MKVSTAILMFCFLGGVTVLASFPAFPVHTDIEWVNFKRQFNKTYESAVEERFRKIIFLNNLKEINEHNDRFREGDVTFELGVNEFADMTNEEFTKQKNGLRSRNNEINPGSFYQPIYAETSVPESIDWRKRGYVTAVKDQGDCGGCWSFSGAGAMEGAHYNKTKDLVSLSMQNLLDCSGSKYGNEGCQGGHMQGAFEYVIQNDGIDTGKSYPYEGKCGKCRYQESTRGAKISSFHSLPSGDERSLKNACGTIGPISVGIDASKLSFQFYRRGVYYEPKCSSKNLDHGVLLVGYGSVENGNKFWLVKNSWGVNWGEQGYIKMARDRDNNCGIASDASYPLP